MIDADAHDKDDSLDSSREDCDMDYSSDYETNAMYGIQNTDLNMVGNWDIDELSGSEAHYDYSYDVFDTANFGLDMTDGSDSVALSPDSNNEDVYEMYIDSVEEMVHTEMDEGLGFYADYTSETVDDSEINKSAEGGNLFNEIVQSFSHPDVIYPAEANDIGERLHVDNDGIDSDYREYGETESFAFVNIADVNTWRDQGYSAETFDKNGLESGSGTSSVERANHFGDDEAKQTFQMISAEEIRVEHINGFDVASDGANPQMLNEGYVIENVNLGMSDGNAEGTHGEHMAGSSGGEMFGWILSGGDMETFSHNTGKQISEMSGGEKHASSGSGWGNHGSNSGYMMASGNTWGSSNGEKRWKKRGDEYKNHNKASKNGWYLEQINN
ncbi:uncharacterized protein [Phyllobates terribilis]|uniref:uncharacterized protein n=1 Tax=Phyllobates terribilis TaxID=111132 RepID=UPI003CCB2D72